MPVIEPVPQRCVFTIFEHTLTGPDTAAEHLNEKENICFLLILGAGLLEGAFGRMNLNRLRNTVLY
jgi:hypothetical protein